MPIRGNPGTESAPADWKPRKAPSGAKLRDAQIAEWFGAALSAPGKWRRTPKPSKPDQAPVASAFDRVAEAMGVEISAEDRANAVTPRQVVEAFGKAVGYLDSEGELIPEIQNKPKGKWLPIAPTIDPVPHPDGRPRRRYYVPDLAAQFEVSDLTIDSWIFKYSPEDYPRHKDELGRIFVYEDELDVWAESEEARASKDPKPHGYDPEGRPFRFVATSKSRRGDGIDESTGRAYQLLPPENFFAKKAAEKAKAGKKAKTSK